ncbi:hypothetical protein EDD73_12537 [Heliophilum fasciatum]|uniref:YitH acetyltransferase (GNAT) domain-containing protein n=1 Tax=Heliophilum fasciatum TaxID=35700 RepID=A0A4V2SWG1_9FIRM|nr:hypothetical protein [Heliophilum fasciatum]TCP61806.1 hypothetical protein EDD73_12537 [Heliophilum fasciatum]
MLTFKHPSKEEGEVLLELDSKVYSSTWQVDPKFVDRLFSINDKTHIIVKNDGVVKGYIGFIPLPKEIYDKVLRQEIDEDLIVDHVLPFYGDIYLYAISILVDTNDPLRKLYSKCLISKVPCLLELYQGLGANIKEIGLIAVTKKGQEIGLSWGLSPSEYVNVDGENFAVLRGKPDDVIRNIRGHKRAFNTGSLFDGVKITS